MILRLFSPHSHGQRKAMRYISKHEADVYLDKEEKTQSGLRTDEKALTPALSSNVKFGLHYNRANSRSCTMMWDGLYLFCFSLFLIENPDAMSFFLQVDNNKEIENNLKQSLLVKNN